VSEIRTAVVIGWVCPGVVVVIFAWPRVAGLLGLGVLAWLAWGWWREWRGR